MQITRAGSQPSQTGPADWFTGRVRIDPLVGAQEGVRPGAALVTFEPGARTHWHTHPLGQALWVVSGLGWVRRDGGAREEVRPGDVVWFEPGERHWHGASSRVGMSHLAMQASQDGSPVTWLEPVSDADYEG
jgi:quercetin dioxygenase-like cupin family protein